MTQLKNCSPAALLASLALALSSSVALATVATGDKIGTSEKEIRAHLVAKGYEVKSVEFESDEIEAEVALNGQELEIEIDSSTGQVIEVEKED